MPFEAQQDHYKKEFSEDEIRRGMKAVKEKDGGALWEKLKEQEKDNKPLGELSGKLEECIESLGLYTEKGEIAALAWRVRQAARIDAGLSI